MTQALIVTTSPKISALITLARTFSDSVTALVIGDAEIAGVDTAMRIAPPDEHAPEALAPAVAAAVAALDAPVVVLAPDVSSERVLAAAAAVALNAPIVTSVRSVAEESGQFRVRRSLYGGIAEEELHIGGSVVIIGDGGAAADGALIVGENMNAEASYQMVVTGEQPADGDAVDLAAALRVLGVGRGFAEKEHLALAEDLAAALGAEIGCTRPLSEGIAWIGDDRYIGLSGVTIAPELYVAAGISGQIQHTAGVGGAKIIVAINDDPDSPIFEVADYSIVADLYQILPALTAELSA